LEKNETKLTLSSHDFHRWNTEREKHVIAEFQAGISGITTYFRTDGFLMGRRYAA